MKLLPVEISMNLKGKAQISPGVQRSGEAGRALSETEAAGI